MKSDTTTTITMHMEKKGDGKKEGKMPRKEVRISDKKKGGL